MNKLGHIWYKAIINYGLKKLLNFNTHILNNQTIIKSKIIFFHSKA